MNARINPDVSIDVLTQKAVTIALVTKGMRLLETSAEVILFH